MSNLIVASFLTDLLSNFFRASLGIYITVLGASLFYGMFFGAIGAAIYTWTRSGLGIVAYFIIVGAMGTYLFHSDVSIMFGMIVAIGIGIIFYRTFWGEKTY